jgi:hypothetical protein
LVVQSTKNASVNFLAFLLVKKKKSFLTYLLFKKKKKSLHLLAARSSCQFLIKTIGPLVGGKNHQEVLFLNFDIIVEVY